MEARETQRYTVIYTGEAEACFDVNGKPHTFPKRSVILLRPHESVQAEMLSDAFVSAISPEVFAGFFAYFGEAAHSLYTRIMDSSHFLVHALSISACAEIEKSFSRLRHAGSDTEKKRAERLFACTILSCFFEEEEPERFEPEEEIPYWLSTLCRRMELQEKGVIKYLGGKTEFLHRGYFDGVDLAFMVHSTDDETCKVTDGSVGFLTKQVVYSGVSAHAGGAPWEGVNALYAAQQGLSAVNAIRETFREQDLIRVHPIITCGGDSRDPEEVRNCILNEARFLAEHGLDQAAFDRTKRSFLGIRFKDLTSFDGTCFRLCAYHMEGYDYFDFPTLFEEITIDEVRQYIADNVRPEKCSLSIVDPRSQK